MESEMKPKLYLALDDTRELEEISNRVKLPVDYHYFYLVRSYAEFVMFVLANGVPDFITFDFDLTLESMKEYIRALNEGREYNKDNVKSKTGLDCVEFLIDHCRENSIKFPEYKIHSANHFGVEWIGAAIKTYLKEQNGSI